MMRLARRARRVVLAALMAAPLALAAQQPPPPSGGAPRVTAQRQLLERQLAQRMARLAKVRLGLTDAQVAQLEPVMRRADGERRRLGARERELRMALRAEVLADTSANQERIAGYLRALVDLQEERIAVLRREHEALSAFLTPLQRARWMALQEQTRQAAQRLQRARQGGDAGVMPGRRLGRPVAPPL